MGCAGGGRRVSLEWTDERVESMKRAAKENADYEQIMSFLSKVALLRRLPKDEHPLLAAACVSAEYPVGKVVIKQGDLGSEFFVIRSGEAEVTIRKDDGTSQHLTTLKIGDYFGENALLRDVPRNSTITAATRLSTLKISRDKFEKLRLHKKLHFGNRRAIAGGHQANVATKPPSPKTAEEETSMRDAIRANTNLQPILSGPLADDRIANMVAIAWKESVPAKTNIIKKGDLAADYFYIVQDGRFDIFVSRGRGSNWSTESAESDLEEDVHVSSVHPGGSFGEVALMYSVPRNATVQAAIDSTVWVIDRDHFKGMLLQASQQKVEQYVQYLSHVNLLSPLLMEERHAIARALAEKHFTKGEVILEQGEQGDTFYILYEGEVSIAKDGEVMTRLNASRAAGTAHVFGERALLNMEPRAATVTVTSEIAKALAMDRDSFDILLGPLQDIITGHPGGGKSMALASITPSFMPARAPIKREPVVKEDLCKVGILGVGGFGVVELWEHTLTGDSYALKSISKGYVVQAGLQESIMNEKNVSLALNSPFIINLIQTYNDEQTVSFLLEVALGGELYDTYNRKVLFGSELHAKFYIAGVVFAFEHCHERRILYRDLKPENLILTENGHIKLTDFGLAKFVIGKTFTTCGTPDYFAPEMITSEGHSNAVDWWTLGVLIFELLTGHPPFESPTPMQVYGKVLKGFDHVPMKQFKSAKVLIKALMKQDPSERLPMRPGGTQNLKDVVWYEGFDWDAMQTLAMEPPLVPEVKSRNEIASRVFNEEELPTHVNYEDDGTGWDSDFASASGIKVNNLRQTRIIISL